ncbi:Fur family transcriptional regulator [Metaclostridioides mangenotii]|uniref:Fur family transcriptional regulator n=1 Tax=Metaclostridioides mangenotii TaxID=1540 RepID=UPI00048020B5|nr:transcriptional repressor [Clostridioides mangenotii]
MKFSKQRDMILEAVRENDIHPTADYIYEKLKKDNPNLSLGTVYRNLSQLSVNGLINKVSFPGEPDRFDAILSKHYHFKCNVCGKVLDIESDNLLNLNDCIAREKGINITSSNISFRGICSDCENKET